jgi:hypothetical protein
MKRAEIVGKKAGNPKSSRHYKHIKTWMKVLTVESINELRYSLAEKGRLWDEWEYKLHRGNIIIYTPITLWDPTAGKPDPKRRYLAKSRR